MNRTCIQCDKQLGHRNKTGYCSTTCNKDQPCDFNDCINKRAAGTKYCGSHQSQISRGKPLTPIWNRTVRTGVEFCPIHNEKHRINPKGSIYCTSCIRETRWAREYGVTTQQAIAMLKEQNYKCKFNNCDIVFSGIGDSQFNIDHCHNSMKVRGILCTRHNLLLGHAKDSEDCLNDAITYLRENR